MRIIVSTHDSIHPLQGGGALRTLLCAREFKRRGHDVMIIAPTDGTGELHGIKVHWLHAPRKHRSQVLSSLKYNVRLLRKFFQFAKQTDMFFIHNTISAVTMPFLKPFFSFRFVLDVTDLHAEYLPIGKRNWFERLATPPLIWMEYAIVRSADTVIVATEAMKRRMIEKGVEGKRIHVVYDGAEMEEIESRKDPGAEKNIIHLGLVDRQHGVDLLIRAIPGVLSKHPNTRFFIIGGGRELSAVRQVAEDLGVQSACTFTGHLPSHEARTYLAKCAIGVIPRPDVLANRIITTLKIFEYWASKTAVVASRLEGIAEIAEDGKEVLFFSPDNPVDLAAQLNRLLDTPILLDQLRENGYQAALRFSWSHQVPQIVDISLGEQTTKPTLVPHPANAEFKNTVQIR
jgi:glycosyltransferase involved in cell wall biosynthesis